MRRYLFPIVVAALALAVVAGCKKESTPTTPGTGGGESGIPEALALAQNIPPMLANGASQTEVYATVVDGKSRALQGIGVRFSTNHGTIDPYATTDDNGVAVTTLTSEASNNDLTATITAAASQDTAGTVAAPSGSVVLLSNEPLGPELIDEALRQRKEALADGVLNTATDVTGSVQVRMTGITLTVTATPTTIPADGKSTARIKANLIETLSRVPLIGETVRFGASEGSVTGEVQTDDTGTATALLTGTTSGTTSEVTAFYAKLQARKASVTFSALSLDILVGAPAVQTDGSTRTPVTARLLNAQRNPVSGAEVDFSTDQGTILSPVTTDEDGMAITTLVTPLGSAQAQVTASFGDLTQNATVAFTTLTFTLASEESSILADGTSTTGIVATLTNPAHNPVAGVPVQFSTSLGTVTSPVVTGEDGRAVATLTSSASTGTATVTANYAGGTEKTVQVQFAAAPAAASILVSADPNTLPADGASQAVLTATVLDGEGNPVHDGTMVTFAVPDGNGSVVTPDRPTTDGVATGTYIAGTSAGTVDVTGTVKNTTVQNTARLSLARLEVGAIEVSAAEDSVLADGLASTVITATVTDPLGNPVAPGTAVLFTTSSGVLEDIQPTDDQGVATARLRAGRFTTGVGRVTATAGGYQAVTDVRFVSEAAAQIVILEVNNPRIGIQTTGANETSQITYEVRDRNGIPVDGNHKATLSFTVVPEDGFTDATVNPATVTTNDKGRAIANVHSGIKAGAIEVQAAAGAILSKPIRIAIHGDLPDPEHFSISFEKLNIPALVPIDGLRDAVTARVADQYGNPVPDSTAVWFSSDFGIVQGSSFTDDHGEATVWAVSAPPRPQIPGGDGLVTITAQTVSKAGNEIFTTGQILWSGKTRIEFTSPTTGQGFNVLNGRFVTLTFRVHDDNDNPLAGGTQIEVTTTAGNLAGDTDIVLPDTQSSDYTTFRVSLSDDAPDEDLARPATITVKVTSPNGNETAVINGTVN
jgi:hypothetical protein